MKRDRIKKLYLVLFLCIATIFTQSTPLQAEGSKDLTENGGYRPYTERYGASTASIEREQRIYVYAKAGEVLYFGSSVYDADAGYDIHVSGVSVNSLRSENEEAIPYEGDFQKYYDVKKDGEGYIDSRAKEIAGANMGSNPDGYTPLHFTVPQEGVYIFRFYSTGLTVENPLTKKVDELAQGSAINNQQKKGSVACWDVSVKGAAGNIIEGRTWTYTLCLNMGSNRQAGGTLNSQVYVLTEDGFTYLTDFNGMDPYGFIFFANSRGLLDLKANTSLYKSVKDPKNDNSLSNLKDLNVGFHNPRAIDTEVDKTHKIFFNQPAADLPQEIKKAIANPQIDEVYFQTDKSGQANDVGDVGAGGYIYVKGENLSTFSIELSFETRINDAGNPLDSASIANRTLSASYQNNTELGEGWTKVRWDGLDGNGKVVPYGKYGDAVHPFITVTPKTGEFHFPMLDIENNPSGVKIISLDNNNAQVYYDNSDVDTLKNLGSYDNSTNGFDSSQGALKFDNKKGDMVAIDLWTYHKAASFSSNTNPTITLKDAVTLGVQKEWNDNNNNDGIRPDSVIVQVYKGGNPLVGSEYTVELNQENHFAYSWNLGTSDGSSVNLDEYDVKEIQVGTENVEDNQTSNYQVEYTISEENITNPSGSTFKSQKNITIKNTHIDETTSVKVKKIWDDGNDADGLRPSKVDVVLMANRAPVSDAEDGYVTLSLSEENQWEAEIKDLPVYNHQEKIDYEFVEVSTLDDYTASVSVEGNLTTITNIHIPEKTLMQVEKIWKDDQDEHKKRPSSIVATLYAGANSTNKKVVLNEENDWCAEIDDLVKNEKGNTIDYHFVEEDDLDFYMKHEQTTNGKTIITNTYDENKKSAGVDTSDKSMQSLYLFLAFSSCFILCMYRKRKYND